MKLLKKIHKIPGRWKKWAVKEAASGRGRVVLATQVWLVRNGANTPEGLSQLLLPSSLPELLLWLCIVVVCRGSVLGHCCPAVAGCSPEPWGWAPAACCSCERPAGTGRGGSLQGAGWPHSVCSLQLQGRPLPSADSSLSIQGGGQEKPLRVMLQIRAGSLWDPSDSPWHSGGLTSRDGNETRAPGEEEEHKILWWGYCGLVSFSRMPIWSLPSVPLWVLPSSTALDAGWEMAHGWIQEWEATEITCVKCQHRACGGGKEGWDVHVVEGNSHIISGRWRRWPDNWRVGYWGGESSSRKKDAAIETRWVQLHREMSTS